MHSLWVFKCSFTNLSILLHVILWKLQSWHWFACCISFLMMLWVVLWKIWSKVSDRAFSMKTNFMNWKFCMWFGTSQKCQYFQVLNKWKHDIIDKKFTLINFETINKNVKLLHFNPWACVYFHIMQMAISRLGPCDKHKQSRYFVTRGFFLLQFCDCQKFGKFVQNLSKKLVKFALRETIS